MYEKILVPLDGSELAEVSLCYAEELAGRLGSEVTLINVYEPAQAPYHRMHEFYMQKMVETTKCGAGRWCTAELDKEKIKIGTVILVGQPAEQIMDYADKEDIGLIVMATQGRSGIGRWALGSVADKVVRATNRPVALIRAKGARSDVREKGILNRVLVPLDGSKGSEAIIPYIEELASKLKTEVILLRIVAADFTIVGDWQMKELESFRASAKDYIESVVAKLKQKGINAKAEFIGGTENTAEVIIRRADELNVDAVAMSTHGRSGVGRWAFGSITERVLQAGTTPLLLVRTR